MKRNCKEETKWRGREGMEDTIKEQAVAPCQGWYRLSLGGQEEQKCLQRLLSYQKILYR